MCYKQKNHLQTVLFFLIAVSFAAAVNAQEAWETMLADFDARAAKIAPTLNNGPEVILPLLSNRAAWEELAKRKEAVKLIETAEKMLNEPILECPEELYKEYFKNGNRDNAQKVLEKRRKRVITLAMAELLENKGRFLPAFEESIRDICAYPSWVLPAHDPEGKVFDRKMVVSDLVSTYFGAVLALLRLSLLDVLSQETADLIKENVEQRVLTPYETAVRNKPPYALWWIRCENNWNTVCHAGTITAAMALLDDPARKAWFAAAAEYFVRNDFFRGFTDDGYCSEGIGYWGYGFGNFAILAEVLYRTTDGEVNLYNAPKVRNITLYAVRIAVAPGFYPAIADGSPWWRPDAQLAGFMSLRLGLGLQNEEKIALAKPANVGSPDILAVYYFRPETVAPAVEPTPYEANEHQRSDFADAGILICRRPVDEKGNADPAQISAFFKGGNNAENHNHNDIGTFGILRGNSWMVQDPGGERYTKRTFSRQRYEGELLNSFGHPVPKIAGTLQKPGKDSAATVLEKSFSDTQDRFKIDIKSAYSVDGLLQAERLFEFDRAPFGTPNRVAIEDTFAFEAGKENIFESALITFAEYEVISASDDGSEMTVRIIAKGKKEDESDRVQVTVTGQTPDSNPLPLVFSTQIVGENDPNSPNKPNRLTWTTKEAAACGMIRFEFTPCGE